MKNQLPDPLKVLMVGALPIDLHDVKGGVEAVIINLLHAFATSSEVDVTHLAFTKETSQEKVTVLSSNVRIRFIPFVSRFDMADYVLNSKNLHRVIGEEKPDVIHIQEITPHLLRFVNFPMEKLIVTQHGIMAEELKYASGIGQNLKCMFKAAVERFVFPNFRNIIFISRYNRKLFRGMPALEARIFNPVNPMFFENTTPPESASHNLLYVGVLSRRKNIKLVIEALHDLKQMGYSFHLHVAGGFKEPAYEEEVMSVVDQFGLRKNIQFHGWLRQDQIRKLYESCPIFILPSMQETLPVSIAEAMAQAKVVVASDVGAIGEMFTDRKSGFLFRKNEKPDLVRTLKEVFDRDEADKIGQSARDEAYQKFHPETIARQTIDFYKKVASAYALNKGGTDS